jgi:hypothetical protein
MPAHIPFPCSHSTLTSPTGFGGNKVFLMNTGSWPGFSNYLNQTWTWNGTDWTRVNSGTIDAAGPLPLRTDAAISYDGYNVMLFGGRGESETSGVLQDTWTFNGTTWTKEAPATVPFGRFKAELSLITAAGANKAVMFGGHNILNLLNETWVWNGSAKTWTLATPTTPPPARIDHMLANGSTFCVLFGGKGINSLFGDTWKFDGAQWTQLTPTTPPPARAEAAFAFDTTRTQYVMFGGRNDNNILGAETWLLNSTGTAWTKAAPATSPSARVGAQMTFDTQSGNIIMFGGNDVAGNSFSDTWSWNGTTWTQL